MNWLLRHSQQIQLGFFGTMEEKESNKCGNGCGSKSLKRVYSLSAAWGIFSLREWLLNWGLDIHPLLRWGEFCLHGFRLPSNQPQLRHLLLCMKPRCDSNQRRVWYSTTLQVAINFWYSTILRAEVLDIWRWDWYSRKKRSDWYSIDSVNKLASLFTTTHTFTTGNS